MSSKQEDTGMDGNQARAVTAVVADSMKEEGREHNM